MVDQEGNAVLDTQDRPITFSAQDTQITISADGFIRSENGRIAELKVVRFANPQNLVAEGDRLFDPKEEEVVLEDRPNVLQGMLEASNIKPILEMTRLTAEMREFQLATQFADREGERISNAVERILRRRS
jgi:flagellar basal-body rod protein FlgF